MAQTGTPQRGKKPWAVTHLKDPLRPGSMCRQLASPGRYPWPWDRWLWRRCGNCERLYQRAWRLGLVFVHPEAAWGPVQPRSVA